MARSTDFMRAPNGRPRLSTLIRQPHLNPSCGGPDPTAERTVGLARTIAESLTPIPELENKICQNLTHAPQQAARPDDENDKAHLVLRRSSSMAGLSVRALLMLAVAGWHNCLLEVAPTSSLSPAIELFATRFGSSMVAVPLRQCLRFCLSGPCVSLVRRADDRILSWKRRSTRMSGVPGHGDR